MEARFLYLGFLGNSAALFLPIILGGWFSNEWGFPILLMLFALGAVLSVFGLLRKGRMDADAAGGLVFGGAVVLILSSVFLYWSFVGYADVSNFCQGLPAAYAQDPRCTQLSESLVWITGLAVAVVVTLTVTFAALIKLRGLSGRNSNDQKSF